MRDNLHFLARIMITVGLVAVPAIGCELIAQVDADLLTTSSAGGAGGTTTVSSSGSSAHGGMTGSGGTGASGGDTTGSGGTTGTCPGGAVACAVAGDCLGTMNECTQSACAMGCCTTVMVASGIATLKGQIPGDCKKVVCDGNGSTTTVVDDSDAPANAGDCYTAACSNGTPTQTPNATGTGCSTGGGQVCGDTAGAHAGHCVGCNTSADCTTATKPVCAMTSRTCVPVSCSDGLENGGETDIDCGGPCGPCAVGHACLVDGDCATTYCQATSKTCGVPTCSDGVKNGAESDIDCGGPCGPCSTGHACLGGGDCTTTYCDATSKTCGVPTCSDGVKNGAESDIDCGGGAFQGAAPCSSCADGKTCLSSGDCTGGFCTPGVALCATPTCSDGFQNGSETDIDCGGGTCVRCTVTQKCTNHSDCLTYQCNANLCEYRAPGAHCDNNAKCDPAGACIDGVCCTTACTGTCVACTAAKKGNGLDGTCGPIAADIDPDNECVASAASTCGFTGSCDGNGACQFYPAGTACMAASCTGSTITSEATCDGSGTCNAGTDSACAGNLLCTSDGTACLNVCAGDSDCIDGNYCVNPSSSGCAALKGAGAMCSANNQCTSTLCDIAGAGYCCASSCLTAGVCGATGCAFGTGACVYPDTTTTLPTGQSTGDCQVLVCDGSGGTTIIDDPADTPTAPSACLVNARCAGVPSVPTFDPAAKGVACTSSSNALAHVCGDPTSSATAGTCIECNVDADCADGALCRSNHCVLSGLVRYYPFDGDTKDYSPSHKDLTNNGATPSIDRFGHASKAYHFDGTSSYMVADGTGIPFGNAERTFTVWIKPNANVVTAGVSSGAFFVTGAGNCTGKMFGMSRTVPSSGMATNFSFWGGCRNYNSGLAIPLSTWTFVAIRWDGAGTMQLNVNGGMLTATGVDDLATTASQLWLGAETMADSATFAQYFNIDLDDLRIYSRSLSDDEIATVMSLP